MARIAVAFESFGEFWKVCDGHVDPDVVGAVRVDRQAEVGGLPLRVGAISSGEADEEKLVVRGRCKSRQCRCRRRRRCRTLGILAEPSFVSSEIDQ